MARAMDPTRVNLEPTGTYCGIVRCTDPAVAVLGPVRTPQQGLRLCQRHRDWAMGEIRKAEAEVIANTRAQRLYDGLQPAEQHSLDGR
jgi:hypothetical protein